MEDKPEARFVDYLGVLFEKEPIDLILSIGAPAAVSCNGTDRDSLRRLRW